MLAYNYIPTSIAKFDNVVTILYFDRVKEQVRLTMHVDVFSKSFST